MKNMKTLQRDLASEAIQHQLQKPENEIVNRLKSSEALNTLAYRVYERYNPNDKNKEDFVKVLDEELEKFLAKEVHGNETAEEGGKKEDN